MSLQGHLELIAGTDDAGTTVLTRQSFAAPIHISKPHHNAGWLVVNLASPTPGLLEGDRVKVDVEVKTGAKLLLTAPSANRIHTMKAGHAELSQSFRVANGGLLDVWPEYLIPQAGARYRQRSRIEIAHGGSLLWTESIAPGRTAHDESFAYSELHLATDIFHGPQQLIRERYRLNPNEKATMALRRRFPSAYYACIVCVADNLRNESDCWDEIRSLHDDGRVWSGTSHLARGAFAVKIIAAESPSLRRAVNIARGAIQRAAGIVPADIRRVTGTSAS